MVGMVGGLAVVLSLLFLVSESLVGLLKQRDRWTVFRAVVVGFLLFTVLFTTLR